MPRMRCSYLARASSTWCPTSVCVEVLLGAKTKSWMRQPQSGRICRSPRAVPMMTRTDSSMFCSYLESWMPPLGPTEKGNLKPTPRKLLMPVSPQVLPCALRGGDPHLDDPLAIRAAHGGAAPLLLHHEPFGEPAFGADEPLRPAGGDRLDDLVPERFQLAQAVLRALRHFDVPPLSQPVADSRRSRSREGPSLVRLPSPDQVTPPPPAPLHHMPLSAKSITGSAGGREARER